MRGLVDVLAGTHKGVECRFYFDPAEGDLLAIELFPDENSDPCEVYFFDYREMDGRFVPGRMAVRFGDEPFATFKIDAFKVEKAGRRSEKCKVRIVQLFPPAWERMLRSVHATQSVGAFSGVAAVLIVVVLASTAAASMPEMIDRVQPKIVKIYGAGGFRGMEAYQSGMLISPTGHILTAYSYVLDTDYITAVLADGRKFRGETGRAPIRGSKSPC